MATTPTVNRMASLSPLHVIISVFLYAVDPPTITQAPTADRVVKGYDATLRCHANGNPAVNYEWFRVRDASVVV